MSDGPNAGDIAAPWFHVVLLEPEIPNNTGNIGRTCVALRSALHLIHPLGFDISEKACRRAGLDYWPRLTLHEHASWQAYQSVTPRARRWLLTTKSSRAIFDCSFAPGDHFVFGRETSGLPENLIREAGDAAVSLPMAVGERSLNLATAVTAVLYEAVRQSLERGGLARGEDGRLRGSASVHAASEPDNVG